MELEKYPNHCSQCGAPLAQKHGKIFCEYCGQVYYNASPDIEEENIEESLEEKTAPQVDREELLHSEPKISIKVSYGSQEKAPINTQIDRKIDKQIGLPIIVVTIFILLFSVCNGPSYRSKRSQMILEARRTLTASVSPQRKLTIAAAEQSTTETANRNPNLIKSIYREQYSGAKYPAASNEDLPLATAAVLEYANANTLIFSLFVYNQSEKDIDASSLEEHLEINSLVVSSDQQDEFFCSLQKVAWESNFLRRGEILHKGVITCDGSLSYKSSSIIIDFDMPNWGSSHLSIPIHSNSNALEPNICLQLDSDHYYISISFQTEAPQLVWVNKSGISIRDDRGYTLPLNANACSLTSENGKGEYFLTMASPDIFHDHSYYSGLVLCSYRGKFPSEANTMEVKLKTTEGNTFTSHTVINKTDGRISFTNETAE